MQKIMNAAAEAAALAVYLHGKSGDIAKECLGTRSVTASAILKAISKAIKQTEENLF